MLSAAARGRRRSRSPRCGRRGAAGSRRGGDRRGARRADGGRARSTRSLLSTELDADGAVRRVGLELYRRRGPDAAADRRRRAPESRDDARRRASSRATAPGSTARGAAPSGPGALDALTPAMPIRAVISDFGGVLTTPLMQLVRRLPGRDRDPGRGARQGDAADRRARRRPPAVRAREGPGDRGRLPATGSRAALEPELGHVPEMHGFKEIYFEALDPNEPMIELMRRAAGRAATGWRC